jgi:hypothetical protein
MRLRVPGILYLNKGCGAEPPPFAEKTLGDLIVTNKIFKSKILLASNYE